MLKNIKFRGTQSENENIQLHTYYQVCQFKNSNGMHETRKIVFNTKGEILKVYERRYTNSEINRFLKSSLQNKYCVYPVRNIEMIGLPNSGVLLMANSSLIDNQCKEYDYSDY